MKNAVAQVGASTGPFTFTRRQLREHSGMANTSLHRCLRELEEFELVVRDTSSRRRPFRYILEWSPFAEKDCAAVVFTGIEGKSTGVPAIFQGEGSSQAASA